jgi:hypothetical protein
MSALISENMYLIPEKVRNEYAIKGKFLLVVTDLENDKQESYDVYMDHFDAIKKAQTLL